MDWNTWKELKIINEGIRETPNGFIVDFTSDVDSDLIKVVSPEIYESRVLGNVYWFGYRFEDRVDSRTRTRFIKWIKGLLDNKPTDFELRQFIEKPLSVLNRISPLSLFTGFIYPTSRRSELVSEIIRITGSYLQHDITNLSYELVKNLPSNINFDWEGFERDVIDRMSFRDSSRYVETNLLPRIRSSDYFSIGEVPPKYRPYIENYLIFKDSKTEKAVKSIQGGKLLVVDDIDTTRSTLKEILRIVGKLNNSCEVYIFTLIGKE